MRKLPTKSFENGLSNIMCAPWSASKFTWHRPALVVLPKNSSSTKSLRVLGSLESVCLSVLQRSRDVYEHIQSVLHDASDWTLERLPSVPGTNASRLSF